MEPCPRLSHLQLDDRSKAGIERLRDIKQLGNFLAMNLGINPLLDIFSKPFKAGYDIAAYDWGAWSAAMSAVPEIVRERIRLEAGLQIIDHLHDAKQLEFWHAIELGCRLQVAQPQATSLDSPPLAFDTPRGGVAATVARARRASPS